MCEPKGPGVPAVRAGSSRVSTEQDLRQELARELHDVVVQELTATLMGLENIKRHPPDERTIAKEVGEVQERCRRALGELRELLCGLRGQEEERADFVSGLRDFATRFEERTGVKVSLTIDREWPSRVPALPTRDLQRIIFEAVSNAHRHGGAHTVSVSLLADTALVRLTVLDDGSGLKLDNAADLGMGIVGMQERALLLGGSITVEPGPGGGTLVRLDFPRAAIR